MSLLRPRREPLQPYEVDNSTSVALLGNVIEAHGGRAVHITNSNRTALFGNSMPQGKNKGVYCQLSVMKLEANSFVGKWPQAISVGKSCTAFISRNLFIQNQISVAVSGSSAKVEIQKNSFISSLLAGIRFFGDFPSLNVEDNLFFKSRFSLLTNNKFDRKKFGRNGAWKKRGLSRWTARRGTRFCKGQTRVPSTRPI